MTEEELQKIIDQFDEDELKRQGIFGIIQYGGGSDESFIRANKEGLELFALELLRSAKEAEKVLSGAGERVIPFDYEESWVDENSNTFIQYVEPIGDRQKIKPRAEYRPTFAEKLVPIGCGLIAIILVISVFVGLATLSGWLF